MLPGKRNIVARLDIDIILRGSMVAIVLLIMVMSFIPSTRMNLTIITIGLEVDFNRRSMVTLMNFMIELMSVITVNMEFPILANMGFFMEILVSIAVAWMMVMAKFRYKEAE